MFNPEFVDVQKSFCNGCNVCAACSICGTCAACLLDGPIPDAEAGGVGAVGGVGLVVGVASW